jgi:hypothetical protein
MVTPSSHSESINPSLDATLMQNPAETTIMSIYGDDDALSAIKMITLAPEMGNAQELIMDLTQRDIVVSLGHTAADYDTGIRVLGAGARMLTHVFKAMNAFSHRSPGVVCTFGLIRVYLHRNSFREILRAEIRDLCSPIDPCKSQGVDCRTTQEDADSL